MEILILCKNLWNVGILYCGDGLAHKPYFPLKKSATASLCDVSYSGVINGVFMIEVLEI
jgi:hypothetical protein